MTDDLSRDLPGDMMLEILCRQPAKTLLKFKCVNKAWYSLIKKPYFIQKHFSYWYKLKYGNFTVVGYDMLSNTTIAILRPGSTIWEHTGISLPGAPGLDLVGGDCGLICLTHTYPSPLFGRDILVINLALMDFKIISKELVRDRKPGKYDFVSIGFGYSHKDGDFKLVRIERPKEDSELSHSKIEMYSLYGNSWKKIKCSFNFLLWNYGGRLSGDSLYWISYKRDEIIAFSLSSERFFAISLPRPIGSNCWMIQNWEHDSIAAAILNPQDNNLWVWISSPRENYPGTYSFSWRRERSVSWEQYEEIYEGRMSLNNVGFPEYYKSYREEWWNIVSPIVPCAHISTYVESLVPVELEVDGQKLDLKKDVTAVDSKVIEARKIWGSKSNCEGWYNWFKTRKPLFAFLINITMQVKGTILKVLFKVLDYYGYYPQSMIIRELINAAVDCIRYLRPR